jgi:endonuclease/exonuclease/phosphatase family metal-dependent hydrolase
VTAVRVLSYNIRSMRDDRAALVRVIRGCAPDVVCLQEVPRFLRWRGKRRWLAERCGLRVAVGRRAAGLAVLARPGFAILHSEYHLLSSVPGLHRRALAIAVLETGGARFVAASTHLDLVGAPRLAHAAEVVALLERVAGSYDAPVILTGDINEEPGGAAWELLAKAYPDAYLTAPRGTDHTFSAGNPRKRIDGVFADAQVEVTGCGVPEEEALLADYRLATDHLPLLAEIRLRDTP